MLKWFKKLGSAGTIMLAMVSVSYTHLDVYKRQVVDFGVVDSGAVDSGAVVVEQHVVVVVISSSLNELEVEEGVVLVEDSG